MQTRRFDARVKKNPKSAACFIELPFDPKRVFGKARAPVRVTINGHTFRTTTASMGGCYLIPLNTANRDGSGAGGGDRVNVLMKPDTAPRVVRPPAELQRLLREKVALKRAWDRLSYTHQKEHAQAVSQAKRPETRARRVQRVVEALS